VPPLNGQIIGPPERELLSAEEGDDVSAFRSWSPCTLGRSHHRVVESDESYQVWANGGTAFAQSTCSVKHWIGEFAYDAAAMVRCCSTSCGAAVAAALAWNRDRLPLHRWFDGRFGAVQTKVDPHLAVHDKPVLCKMDADQNRVHLR
jgi:hypothetical protein